MAVKQIKAKKGIKKDFFEVSAPLVTTKILLYAAEKKELEGKIVKIDLTKALRGKNLELNLRVKLSGENLIGDPEKIELAKSYLLKVMRKGIDYVEDSFEVECRDCFAKIKPFLLTRKRVSREILKALRNETKEFLAAQTKIRTSLELFSDIISNKIQKQLSLKLKKVYPLALCEIRVFEILKRKENYKETLFKEPVIKLEEKIEEFLQEIDNKEDIEESDKPKKEKDKELAEDKKDSEE